MLQFWDICTQSQLTDKNRLNVFVWVSVWRVGLPFITISTEQGFKYLSDCKEGLSGRRVSVCSYMCSAAQTLRLKVRRGGELNAERLSIDYVPHVKSLPRSTSRSLRGQLGPELALRSPECKESR